MLGLGQVQVQVRLGQVRLGQVRLGLEKKLGQVWYKKFSWVRLGLIKNRFKKKLVQVQKKNQVRLGLKKNKLGWDRLGQEKKVRLGQEKKLGQVRLSSKKFRLGSQVGLGLGKKVGFGQVRLGKKIGWVSLGSEKNGFGQLWEKKLGWNLGLEKKVMLGQV